MALSLYGLLVVGIALLMLVFKRPLREFYAVMIVCGVFGAAEALSFPMMGGSSLTTPTFFVLFLIIRLLFLARRKPKLVAEGIGANMWLILFAAYGLVTAMIMPKLFEGSMSVVAMRPLPYPVLLTATSQNITQSVYITLTALTAIAAYVTARVPKSDSALILGWSIASVLFVLFALVDVVGYYGGGKELMGWAKTASYAMLSQSEMGVKRISGSFTEPSSFAAFGQSPLLFFAYLWLLNVRSTLSGLLALAIAMVMALSTSTSAYMAIAVGVTMIGCTIVVGRMSTKTRLQKFVLLLMALLTFVALIAVAAFIMPKFVTTFLDVLEKMTIGKSKSASAIERASFAAQGLKAFAVSHGVGIGPGSFRSSGLAHAIIGCMGVVGCICMLMYCFKVGKVVFRNIPSVDNRIIHACATTALLTLIPQLAANPSCDPGIYFAAFSGYALGRQKQAFIEARAKALDDQLSYETSVAEAAPRRARYGV